MVTGNGAAWIILSAGVSAVVIAVLAALRRDLAARAETGLIRHAFFWEFMTLTMIDGMDAAERVGLPADLDEEVELRHARASFVSGVHDVVERYAADCGREGPGPVVAALECWLFSASFPKVGAAGIMPGGGAGPRC